MGTDKLRIVATNLSELQDELEAMWEDLHADYADVDRLKKRIAEAQIAVFATGQLVHELREASDG
jgi:hypothetical protein